MLKLALACCWSLKVEPPSTETSNLASFDNGQSSDQIGRQKKRNRHGGSTAKLHGIGWRVNESASNLEERKRRNKSPSSKKGPWIRKE